MSWPETWHDKTNTKQLKRFRCGRDMCKTREMNKTEDKCERDVTKQKINVREIYKPKKNVKEMHKTGEKCERHE